jgi:predicted AAA+ superfamily ATPase
MRFDRFEYERLQGYYEEFIRYGGLPDVVLEGREQIKREILSDIFSSYINIDVRALADFQKIGELRQLLQVLALRIGNKLDISKLATIVGLSRATVGQYLEFLEKTYLIQRLPAWAGPDRATVLGKKLYFCDNGIASLLANPGEGALLENAVFNQLRPYGELAYFSKGSQFEIDFILARGATGRTALEVKFHPVVSDDQKLKRVAAQVGLQSPWLVGKHPTPGFKDFLWAGLIF